ncbi:MAG: hypothetical protein D1H97_04290 [Paracoccus sp. BP8]|nr:MAG: hypothetical protein D1H97_04290 [Paracoccus sp. BP8]
MRRRAARAGRIAGRPWAGRIGSSRYPAAKASPGAAMPAILAPARPKEPARRIAPGRIIATTKLFHCSTCSKKEASSSATLPSNMTPPAGLSSLCRLRAGRQAVAVNPSRCHAPRRGRARPRTPGSRGYPLR